MKISESMPWSCGLMQESKDIQQRLDEGSNRRGCGLMQESKDIQLGVQVSLA